MSKLSSLSAWPRRAATLGLLLAPLLLSACYVVPVAPAPGYRYHDRYDNRYRDHHRHHHHRHHGWHGQAAPAVESGAQIVVTGSSR